MCQVHMDTFYIENHSDWVAAEDNNSSYFKTMLKSTVLIIITIIIIILLWMLWMKYLNWSYVILQLI